MNIYAVIEIIESCLAQAAEEKGNILYGASIETDPYKPLENKLPLLLIEEGASQLAANPQGYVYEYLHSIDLTCAVKTGKDKRELCRKKAAELAEGVVKELQKISDFRLRVIPKEMEPGDIIIGSLKCSAVNVNIEVRTCFME